MRLHQPLCWRRAEVQLVASMMKRIPFQMEKALAALILALIPSIVHAWGSLYPGETHQHILRQAFALLVRDPAYSSGSFPSIDAMLAHEGVNWTLDGGLKGIGPDAAGMSRYSDHYYNPVTQEGTGPQASAYYFRLLSRATAQGQHEAAAKAAAWGAHFLADMFVPFHVVGTTRERASAILEEQTALHPGLVELPREISGSDKLGYLSPFKGGSRNFHTEIRRLLYKTNPDESDWFDPWYLNGNTDIMMTKTSSHIAWEVTPQPSPYNLPRFVPFWTNATAQFHDPQAMQAEQVRRLAVISATETRNKLEDLFDAPAPGINRAIQSVHTMWRSSFSGMRPSMEVSKESSDTFLIRGVIRNVADADVSALTARLTPHACRVLGPVEVAVPGTIAPAGSTKTPSWRVRVDNEPCRLKLEVTGRFSTPDLQYAAVESQLAPPDQPNATGIRYTSYFDLRSLYALDSKANIQQGMACNNFYSGAKVTWKGNAFSYKAKTEYKPSGGGHREIKEVSFDGTVASDASRIESFLFKSKATIYRYDEISDVRVEHLGLKDIPLVWSPEKPEFDGTKRMSYRFSLSDPLATLERMQTFYFSFWNGQPVEWKKPLRFTRYSESELPVMITFSKEPNQ